MQTGGSVTRLTAGVMAPAKIAVPRPPVRPKAFSCFLMVTMNERDRPERGRRSRFKSAATGRWSCPC